MAPVLAHDAVHGREPEAGPVEGPARRVEGFEDQLERARVDAATGVDGVSAGLFDWVMSPFTVMPIQIFNWTSRPDPAFEVNAAAAGFVLMGMVLSMNAIAIYLRYRMRKNIKW